jgi:hypothetical protein
LNEEESRTQGYFHGGGSAGSGPPDSAPSARAIHSNAPQPVLDYFTGHNFDYKVNEEQEVEEERGFGDRIEFIDACNIEQLGRDYADGHNQSCARQFFRSRIDRIDREQQDGKHQDCIG